MQKKYPQSHNYIKKSNYQQKYKQNQIRNNQNIDRNNINENKYPSSSQNQTNEPIYSPLQFLPFVCPA